jgi:hypothetical protein
LFSVSTAFQCCSMRSFMSSNLALSRSFSEERDSVDNVFVHTNSAAIGRHFRFVLAISHPLHVQLSTGICGSFVRLPSLFCRSFRATSLLL